MRAEINKAARFAQLAHADVRHFRKYTGEPYIVHPEEVATILFEHDCEPESIIVAYLHDVLEDTKATYENLVEVFGQYIADLVVGVSDVPNASGNRAERMKIHRDHYAQGCSIVQNVKVADLISNCWSICEYDPSFGKLYLKEKRELLNVLTKAKKSLLAQAWKEIAHYTRMFASFGLTSSVEVPMPTRNEIHGED